MVLGPHFGDYAAGIRFGKVGFDVLEKRGQTRFKANVYLDFGCLLNPWTGHLGGYRAVYNPYTGQYAYQWYGY